MNEARCLRLTQDAIEKFALQLSGLTVLTEAATGYYALTPLIAALAGAERVYMLSGDSRYGSAEDAGQATLSLSERWGVVERIKMLTGRRDPLIADADIVTNLGFVRPIDKDLLSRFKSTVVIPLMWETSEFRKEDLDLAECRKRSIPVMGTNELLDTLDTFGYIGPLAMKLTFEMDIEVYRARVVVVGGGHFGRSAVSAFRQAGADVFNICVTKGHSLGSERSKCELVMCELVVFVEHESRELLLGDGGQLEADELAEINPGISIVHIAGGVDQDSVCRAKLHFRPTTIAQPGYMSAATDYLGPKPLIDLHTAGLKVGETMAKAVSDGHRGQMAERRAAEMCNLAQSFE